MLFIFDFGFINSFNQYIGTDYKATYTEQSREIVDKAEVKKILCEEDFRKVRNVTFYHTLRIR